MAREFRETAHLKTDKKKYDEGYARIFGPKCKICKKPMTPEEDCGGDCLECMEEIEGIEK